MHTKDAKPSPPAWHPAALLSRLMAGIPAWLQPAPISDSHQTDRIRSVERNVVLPVKAAVVALLYYYLYFSNWIEDVYTFREAVLLTVRVFLGVYAVVTILLGAMLAGMDRLPMGLVREGIMVSAVVDALFVGALLVITNGFDSLLYWMLVALILRNSASVPSGSTQIVLNAIVVICYLAAGFTEVAVTRAEPDLSEETNEPYVLRAVVLILVAACGYGVQMLLERDRAAREEEQEFEQRKQQLASAGRLAAEIAHQLKNPLGIINNAAFNLQRTLKEGKTITQQIQIIRDEVERSDRILTELMGYARLVEDRVERLDIRPELEAALARVLPEGTGFRIRVRREYGDALPPLFMQRGHLAEILVNLLQNAREALEGEGEIHIRTRMTEGYVMEISIGDNGPGMDPATAGRIFDPYFTTKTKGTGLGLAIVKHNAELYGGRVRVESALGQGTRFVLEFPAKTAVRLRR